MVLLMERAHGDSDRVLAVAGAIASARPHTTCACGPAMRCELRAAWSGFARCANWYRRCAGPENGRALRCGRCDSPLLQEGGRRMSLSAIRKVIGVQGAAGHDDFSAHVERTEAGSPHFVGQSKRVASFRRRTPDITPSEVALNELVGQAAVRHLPIHC